MKRICPLCDRLSQDGNLWCQERACPAETAPIIMNYGDFLGDIQVIRLLFVFRSAAVYQAQRGEETVLLKIAHHGSEEQLKREAVLLAELKGQHPGLPVLLPPYQQADVKQRPYGKTIFRHETKYFAVFEYVEGQLLKEILLRNPQPWFQHVGWLSISLADVVAFLHLKANKVHLNLSPDRILIRIDLDGIYRPMLLDLGVVTEVENVDLAWAKSHLLPAYTAPEVLKGEKVTPLADVYGLGLLLYEMLAGEPAFDTRPNVDDDVREIVIKNPPPALNRNDLANEISALAMQALDKSPSRRPQNFRDFAKPLRTLFGEVPVERKMSSGRRRFYVGAVSLALLVMVVILALSVL